MARKYDHEYKVQAVKLAKEIGGAKAAKELGIPEGTIHTWLKAAREQNLSWPLDPKLTDPVLGRLLFPDSKAKPATSKRNHGTVFQE